MDGPEAARFLCHPQSPLAGDPAVLAKVLAYLDEHMDVWHRGERLEDQFHSPWPHHTYLLLSAVYPDLVPPSKRRKWDEAVAKQADFIVSFRGRRAFLNPKGHCNTNHDVHYVHALYCAAKLLGKPDYVRYAEGGLKMIERQWLADGAFEYNQDAMPVLYYHGLCTYQLVHIWLVSGNPLARDLTVRQWWYFPLTLDDRYGLSNYSTAVGYKQFQELAVRGQYEFAYLISSLSGSRENFSLAKPEIEQGKFWGSRSPLFHATLYRPGIAPLPLPDDYVAFDRNLQGPRGRFGPWVFEGSTSFDNGWGGWFIHKYSYVGCTAFDGEFHEGRRRGARRSGYDMVALQAAGSEVRVAPGMPKDARDRETHCFHHTAEKSAATVLRTCAAVTGRHGIGREHRYKRTDIPWESREEWLFTPERMVGLVTLEAREDNEAYAMGGFLKLLGSRYRPTPEFERKAPDAYAFGGLVARFHEHDYGSIVTERDDQEGRKVGYILLLDPETAAAGQTRLRAYRAGTRRFYLVELRPERSGPARAVERLELGGGLVGFDVHEAASSYRIVHNPADRPARYAAKKGEWPGRRAYVYASGARHRPEWMSTYVIPDTDIRPRPEQFGGPEQDPEPAKLEDVRAIIPPHAHLLIVSPAR